MLGGKAVLATVWDSKIVTQMFFDLCVLIKCLLSHFFFKDLYLYVYVCLPACLYINISAVPVESE